jgi:protein SCO1/2
MSAPATPPCAARRRSLAALLACTLLAACGPSAPQFKGSDVTGTSFGRDFELVDHNGVRRTLADFRGKVVVMFFGYAHCPDVCPTTMAELAEAMKRLGGDAARVQVLFVTVDPARDTAELM